MLSDSGGVTDLKAKQVAQLEEEHDELLAGINDTYSRVTVGQQQPGCCCCCGGRGECWTQDPRKAALGPAGCRRLRSRLRQ
eukprot:3456566-Rhodomonas_salina.1